MIDEERTELLARLRAHEINPHHGGCADCYGTAMDMAADELERLQTENWQLKQACGYPIPADRETINNPFKCGMCDARRVEQSKDREWLARVATSGPSQRVKAPYTTDTMFTCRKCESHYSVEHLEQPVTECPVCGWAMQHD